MPRTDLPTNCLVQSIHFKTMIHKIHTGEDLLTDFTVYPTTILITSNSPAIAATA